MTGFARDIVATAQSISELTDQVSGFLRDAGVDDYATHHVMLVLDEVLTNLVMHGDGTPAPASVRLAIAPDRVKGEIVDSGTSFDPRTAADPDRSGGIAERAVGGLGLFLVRQLTAELDYVSEGGRNVTRFSVLRRL